VTTHAQSPQTRRRFLRNASLAASFFAIPGAFAEELLRQTPWVTQGQLDTDNDLIIVSNSLTPAFL
jgi:protocatechuate 3,4-dioxygenase, beta subunit